MKVFEAARQLLSESKAKTPPSFELVVELLDLPEKRNAGLTSTVSIGWRVSGRSGIRVTP
jgi:hypothetical protein